jgi:hypothetical protein
MPKPNEWSIDNDTKPIEPHFCRKQRGEPKKLRCRGPEENEPQENVS